jgi:hypothetical protein
MSRTIRQTALSGLLGSKRFIVSVCAAIAMVLGAMSVGASVFTPQTSAENQEKAANSPVFTERGSESPTNTTRESGDDFTNQHTLIPNILTQSQPSSLSPAIPKIRAGLGLQFGPASANAGINLGGLQIKLDTSFTPAETPSLPSLPAEVPVVETPKDENPTPVPPDEPQPPGEESAPEALDARTITPTVEPAS